MRGRLPVLASRVAEGRTRAGEGRLIAADPLQPITSAQSRRPSQRSWVGRWAGSSPRCWYTGIRTVPPKGPGSRPGIPAGSGSAIAGAPAAAGAGGEDIAADGPAAPAGLGQHLPAAPGEVGQPSPRRRPAGDRGGHLQLAAPAPAAVMELVGRHPVGAEAGGEVVGRDRSQPDRSLCPLQVARAPVVADAEAGQVPLGPVGAEVVPLPPDHRGHLQLEVELAAAGRRRHRGPVAHHHVGSADVEAGSRYHAGSTTRPRAPHLVSTCASKA